MILVIDVDYRENEAFVAAVTFKNFNDKHHNKIFTTLVEGVVEYQSGQFYKRELPCILNLLKEYDLNPKYIVIDGFVFLDGHSKPGLGKYLYDALEEKSIIIGVAKRSFDGISSKYELYRGKSRKPLFITSVGVKSARAKTYIQNMAGEYRIPTLLKKADKECRLRFK